MLRNREVKRVNKMNKNCLRLFECRMFPLRFFLFLLLISVLLIAALGHYFSTRFEDYLNHQVRDMAMNQARIIASNDSVVAAVEARDTAQLGAIVRRLARGSDFDYLVIGDRHSIRLYHPNPAKIGYPMQWTKPGALEKGESYFISGEGSIGVALRAKTPVFDRHGRVVGVVSLGYLSSKIEGWRRDFILPVAGAFAAMLFLLLMLWWLFAAYLKRRMRGMEQYVDGLRTQRHEQLNWMSTINGLLQMKEYDRVLEMVHGESDLQQAQIDWLMAAFADRQLVGLLFGKMQRARELGLTLAVADGSQLRQLPEGLNSAEFASIVGNLLDNAFEASRDCAPEHRTVELYLSDEGIEVLIEVADRGCGIAVDRREAIFNRGVSSKTNQDEEHGIGLYLIAGYVARCGGVITLEDNPPCGSLFSIYLPKVKPTYGTTSEHFDR